MKLKFSNELPNREGWWFANTQVIYADSQNLEMNGCIHAEYINIESEIPFFIFFGDNDGTVWDQRIDCKRLNCKWAGPIEFEE